MENEAIKFIDKLYRDLYLSEEVLHHSSSDKTDKYRNIKEYLDMQKDMHERASLSDHRKEILKRMYHDKYVIKREDIPESFYEHQKRVALERGYGHIDIDDKTKIELQNQVITDQEKSLDIWLDYFLSDDTKVYPFWAKYWAFQGMLKLGTYNKETATFNRRTKNTTSIFADLNREALALSIDMMIKVLNKESIDDKDLEVLVKGGSFQRIYPYILNKVLSDSTNVIKRNEGKWVKYNRGPNYMPLVNSLKGYNTGWCTAGEGMARNQLRRGDFYVYYTLDENGEYKVPRIAIRMEDFSIGEIRGVAKNQNLEPEMEDVLQEKLKDFPDKDKYYKKVNDMKRLTNIYNNKETIDLSIEDLRFLYQIDERIKGFGYSSDPRIDEIINSRNACHDIARILNLKDDEVALSKLKIKPNTKCYYNGYNHYDLMGINSNDRFPEIFIGNIHCHTPSTLSDVVFPKRMIGNINLYEVHFAHNLRFPEELRGGISLPGVFNLSDTVFPKKIDTYFVLAFLRNIDNVTMPEEVGFLNMESISTIKDLVFPKVVNGNLSLTNLKSCRNVVFPEIIKGDFSLNNISEGYEIVFPKVIEGDLITSRKILDFIDIEKLEKIVNGTIYIDGMDIDVIRDLRRI